LKKDSQARIRGQERAVRRMSGLYQIISCRDESSEPPIGTMLFLGPTGSGKTRVIEAAAEVAVRRSKCSRKD